VHHRTWIVLALLGTASRTSADSTVRVSEGEPTSWGLGVKVRRWWVTDTLQQIFVEKGPGTSSNDGAGLDFARRQGNTEISFGFGYDRLDGREGYYLEKGADPTMPGNVDYVTFDRLQSFSAEVTVVTHYQIHKLLELRFGAGLGIGYLRGELRKTDAICTSDRLQQDCMIDPAAMEVNEPAKLLPVLPVVNALVGLQLVPFDAVHIHVDAGLHSVPFVGGGVTFYFW
jgi:hypothetical protein